MATKNRKASGGRKGTKAKRGSQRTKESGIRTGRGGGGRGGAAGSATS